MINVLQKEIIFFNCCSIVEKTFTYKKITLGWIKFQQVLLCHIMITKETIEINKVKDKNNLSR